MKNRIAVALIACAFPGCAGMVTPEHIKASKDGTAICTEAFSPWGRGRTVYLNIDRNVIQQGAFQVTKDCDVVFNNTIPTPPVLRPAAP